MIWLTIGAGGALGSMMRHAVNVAVTRWTGRPGPWSTFAVNMLGSFVIGLLAGLLASTRLTMTPTARVFVFVGVIGGFTTFSSYMLDSFTLAEEGQRIAALLNVAGQVTLGYALAIGATARGCGDGRVQRGFLVTPSNE